VASGAPSSSMRMAVIATLSPRPRASMVTGPGLTVEPGAGCGSSTHGLRPGTAVAVSVGPGAVGAGVAGGVWRGVLRMASGVARSAVGLGGGIATAAGVGVTRADEMLSADRASATAEASAPMADQARLPSKTIPTIPTMVAMIRAGEPSSDGGAGRATV
jgi:hypothetical protein